tara:strand:+ start:4461 stop:5030 length:570 start_codon:yes stop_codon:yes gene_type:complete
MPRTNFGGNKKRRGAKRHSRMKTYSLDDLIPSKDDNQAYAYVSQKYGDGRYSIMCYDKVSRMGIVAGKLKKSSRIDKGALVLVSLREYQDNKCDIIYHYTPEDIDKLTKSNNVNLGFVRSGTLSANDEENIKIHSTTDIQDTISHESVHSSGSDIQAWSDNETTVNNKDQERIIKELKEEYEEFNIDDL